MFYDDSLACKKSDLFIVFCSNKFFIITSQKHNLPFTGLIHNSKYFWKIKLVLILRNPKIIITILRL